MKSIILLGFLVALVTFVAIAGVVLAEKPSVTPQGGSVTIEWRTVDETGVSGFKVLRSVISPNGVFNFSPVNQDNWTAARGMNGSTYKFTDEAAFKTTENIYVYKVRVVFTDGSQFDSDMTDRVRNTTASAAKRTWGSIKAMFR